MTEKIFGFVFGVLIGSAWLGYIAVRHDQTQTEIRYLEARIEALKQR